MKKATKLSASDGEFINKHIETRIGYKICNILGTEIRVWGSESGKGLGRELVSALRPIIKRIKTNQPIALMADHHPAEFGVVGSVIASADTIVPDLIGSDCGCGVFAAQLNCAIDETKKDLLEILYKTILAKIPVGRAQNQSIEKRIEQLSIWDELKSTQCISAHDQRKLRFQMGSLGGGNHFIELAKDGDDKLWLLVHSGSRFLGGLLKDCYNGKTLLRDSDEANEFLLRQQAAINFAQESRLEMSLRVRKSVSELFNQSCDILQQIDLPHNFISIENVSDIRLAVHRKGACSAAAHTLGVIPGSMGTGSYLVEGKGNPWSYNSSSHGAGRRMSRGDAFRKLSTADLLSDMQGIVWGGSERLKDEGPRAYKDIDSVINAQKDLIRVVSHLRPIFVVKGER